MESKKLTYAEVLKNQSGYLNAGINDQTPKPITAAKKPKAPTPQNPNNTSQPLVLATASDWVVPGSLMRSAIYETNDGAKCIYDA